ncbi:TPA: hypothetical protein ACOTG0_002119 [Clostridium perfringens]|nr:hypothetical protein phiCPD_00032 [Clostridium phage phiCp-D]
MKDMSLVMKEAHKMAKEIKAEFPEVDYKTQLGLCMSYLLNEKGESEMVELQGTEKQVKWANDIRGELVKIATKQQFKRILKLLNEKEEAVFFIDNFKFVTSKFLDGYKKYEKCFSYEMDLEEIENAKKYGW